MDFGLRMFACQISGKEYPNTMKTKVLLSTHTQRQADAQLATTENHFANPYAFDN